MELITYLNRSAVKITCSFCGSPFVVFVENLAPHNLYPCPTCGTRREFVKEDHLSILAQKSERDLPGKG